MPPEIGIVVTAKNEADCLPQTLAALAGAFPGASVVVADDGSSDATPDVARDAGADVVRSERPVGKGGAATRGAERLLATGVERAVLLCDGDLGASAAQLVRLVEAVGARGRGPPVAGFARRLRRGLRVPPGFAPRAGGGRPG